MPGQEHDPNRRPWIHYQTDFKNDPTGLVARYPGVHSIGVNVTLAENDPLAGHDGGGSRSEVVKNLSNDPRFDMNCHGYTFLGGDYWLNPENVRAGILGLGYREIDPVSEEVKVGDKVLYDVPSSKDPNRRDFPSATVVDLYSPGTLVRGISGNEVTPSVTTLKGAVNWSDA